MKKTALILFVLIFTFGLFGSALAGPAITIPESVFDFGYVPQHSKISHIFWLHSTGTDSLKIIKIKPGWGCTKAPLEKDELAVGDSTKLEIIFSTKSYRNRTTKRPSIETNEGPDKKFVQITANIYTNPDSTYPVIVKPYKLDISQFGETPRNKMEFFITNVTDEKLGIELIDMPIDMFKISLPKSVKPGKTAKAKIELLKGIVSQEFEKSITLEFTGKETTRFTIPVKRKIRIPGKKAEGTKPIKKTTSG